MRTYNLLQAERDALTLFLREGPCTPENFKHGTDPDGNFDPEQLEQGVQVETEHTDDLAIAKAIAKAHLAELPDYYTRLATMEAEGKAEVGNSSGAHQSVRGSTSSVYRDACRAVRLAVRRKGVSCL